MSTMTSSHARGNTIIFCATKCDTQEQDDNDPEKTLWNNNTALQARPLQDR